jgi:hypothetical protein
MRGFFSQQRWKVCGRSMKVARLNLNYSGVLIMKKQIKKLTLAKETLRNLDEKEMLLVPGGISASACGKATCRWECGPTGILVC